MHRPLALLLLSIAVASCSAERQITIFFTSLETFADSSERIAVWTQRGSDTISFGDARVIERNITVIDEGDTVTSRVWYPAGVPVDTAALVLLIPSFGETTLSLFPLALETTRRGLVTAMLQPRGAGFNVRLPATYGIGEIDDAIALINTYARRHTMRDLRVGIFGASLGGIIGLHIAERSPSVRAIALEGVMPALDTAAARVMSVADYTRATELLSSRGETMAQYSPLAVLPRLRPMPLLAIWGSGDRLVTIDERARLRELLAGRTPAATVVEIEGGAHTMRYGFPLSAEGARELNARVGEFLRAALQ
jgi:pimeloyl-ACP methyl ester carboxylesterase